MKDFADVPLGRLLGVVGRMVAARFQRVLDAEGLTHAGWQVLLALWKEDGLTQRDVAERTYVTQATVTGVVDTLERDGFVTRARDENDRRIVRVALTAAGRKRLKKTFDTVTAEMAPVFEGMTEREEQVVRRFLLRTVDRLRESG